MPALEKIIFPAIRHVIANEADLDFPAFLKNLITASSIRPWHVTKHLGINRQRFFCFMNKNYFRAPREEDLQKIAEYFSVPQELLARKLSEFVLAQK